MSIRNTWRRATACVAIATACCFASNTQAEDTITTGDGLLSLTANMPTQVRAGEEFSYDVKVTNTSDNVTLHNIQLKQLKASGFSVAATSVAADAVAADDSAQAQKKAKESEANTDASQQAQNKTQQKNQNKAQGEMNIAVLKPGESKTITVTASADEEGELRSCLAITNYLPAICLTSQVIKPELQLTKVAPQQADRCNVIKLEYTVTNGGSGNVGPFVISDSLGEGLATIDGDESLKFQVDGLEAGDSRKFIASVYATKPGTFTSRATAKAENSELSSRSKETTTEVIAADLDVQVKGPSRLYGEQLARFTAHVTNTGNVAAENVDVSVFWPEACDLVDRSQLSLESPKQSASDSNKQSKGEPTPAPTEAKQADAKPTDGKSTDKKDQVDQSAAVAMSDTAFTIERLEAGQTAIFEYAIRTGNVDAVPTKVVARYVCNVAPADDQAKARSEATSTATAQAKIVRLPAMQIVVVDDQDPVTMDSNVVYSIRVWNEGNAQDSNVTLKVELPEGLELVSATGPTENSAEGTNVSFKPIETLQAGDRADYKITAKSTGDGDLRFKATLNSKSLSKEVIVEESTRIFAEDAK